MDSKNRIAGKRGLKRKLEFEFESEEENGDRTAPGAGAHRDLAAELRAQVDVLSSEEEDRVSAKNAVKIISEHAQDDDNVDLIVECGAVPVLVKHLRHSPSESEGENCTKSCNCEMEKECAFALGLLAINPQYQELIVNAGALSLLIDLVKRHKNDYNSRSVNSAIRKTADAITHLAHENSNIKNYVRIEGGIPPLIELLESTDMKVQRAAAGALRTLAFKNDKNKIQIIECDALPTLVQLLRSEDATLHCEAVGVIGNLVHSSPNIKKQVLLAGALQPVIGLLNSSCTDSQREAALLLGQFATADSECKAHIVQRGALSPLIDLLQSHDVQLMEMSAFALGRLAQDTHNQAGIAHSGAIAPLIKLLDSKNVSLQHNAAFTLYGLADNEDNVADLIRLGAVQKLQDSDFAAQQTKDCVAKTLKRFEEKIHGRVLKHLLYQMRVGDKTVQKQFALALAHLCASDDQKSIFIDNNGLELLLGLLESASQNQRKDGSEALHKLATKIALTSPMDTAPLSPIPQVYLGEQYVNNPTLSDVTFLIEGKRFYAHRICLLASSDAFRAMFDGGYRESDANDIEIPNISWDVFELMMIFIYTGSVDVSSGVAHALLRAADQYLLDGLKCLCEHTIAQDISVENAPLMYELSETFNAVSLRKACILFILQQSDKLRAKPWYTCLIRRIIPEIRNYFTQALTKPFQDPMSQA